MTKALKSDVHYRKGKGERRCEYCTMFRPPHGCTAVVGIIDEDDVCDLYKRRRKSYASDKE